MNNSLVTKADKIYVAGHNGMVGNAIVKNLKKNGFNNLLLVSREKLDLTNRKNVFEWIENFKPDVVIIAAAKVGGICANNDYPVNFLLENLKIQNNLIEASFVNNIKRLLFLGSSCIYPKLCNQPIKEEYLLNGLLEKTNEWYAIAKISGIKLCEALRKQYGFDAFSLMPTNLYGPGDNYNKKNSHVLPALIRKFSEAVQNKENEVICWGTGSPKREFLHVDDLADACTFVLINWDINSRTSPKYNNNEPLSFLNVGTGIDISIKDLASLVAEKCGYSGKIVWDHTKPDGTPQKLLDVSRLNNLGWKYKVNLNVGVQKTIQCFENELRENKVRI
tara:strand:+ start:3475 stop:4476 length:1002 start_codon:yes stop_codon:yes gene_type:complete